VNGFSFCCYLLTNFLLIFSLTLSLSLSSTGPLEPLNTKLLNNALRNLNRGLLDNGTLVPICTQSRNLTHISSLLNQETNLLNNILFVNFSEAIEWW
jgi:hypothetical protein